MRRGLHRRFSLRQLFIERYELMRSAAFERAHALALLQQKVLQRTQQERAQAALLLIGPAQRVVLK